MKSLIIMGENLDQIMSNYEIVKRLQHERDQGAVCSDDTYDIAVFEMHKALVNAIDLVNEKPAEVRYSNDFDEQGGAEDGGVITFDDD